MSSSLDWLSANVEVDDDEYPVILPHTAIPWHHRSVSLISYFLVARGENATEIGAFLCHN